MTASNGTNGDSAKMTEDPLYQKTMSFIRPNWLKEKMEAGGLGFSFGMSMTFSPDVALLAKVAGYTAVLINLEHCRAGIETACDVACACLNIGISPICVVPSLQSDWISRLLDNGVQGIIVPRTGTAAMAKELVKYSKFRPLGERPLTSTPQMQYQLPHPEYAKIAQNNTTLTMPMIETVEGLENCEEIAAVEGVDAVFVGAWDLADDMGIGGQRDSPLLYEALSKICRAATKHNKYVGLGGMEPRPDIIAKLRKEFNCVRYVMAGRDTAVFQAGMNAQVKTIKEIEAST
ncbi:hypothetical protein I203_107158 [Kwoniella mangroviensis CBS 8507]|uniref:hypothetical protein n=1 Tax=Kwoniella mangroviensis CBS 8507 TaxID=1296122 RepID=UPI00080CD820|nr:uncharacterized protein I203_01905 [Kwoniella mangroviensis CBS 8507]OCF68522.1 hypothetical protein I203_01905 [Kwoniella mangroviensis CBS 8507]